MSDSEGDVGAEVAEGIEVAQGTEVAEGERFERVEGVQGVQGVQGVRGIQGPQGMPGTNDRLVIASEDPQIVEQRALLVSRIYVALAGFAALIVFLYGGLFILYSQVQELDGATAQLQVTADENKAATLQNRENGFRGRAVNCQILVSLGEELPPQCLEEPVVALYDPEAAPTAGANSEGQKLNRALLCGLYGEMGLPLPEVCEPPVAP